METVKISDHWLPEVVGSGQSTELHEVNEATLYDSTISNGHISLIYIVQRHKMSNSKSEPLMSTMNSG